MPLLQRLDLPTGMTITLGCAWPSPAPWRGAGDAGTDQGRAEGPGAAAVAGESEGDDGVPAAGVRAEP